MKRSLRLAVLFAASLGQAQSLKMIAVHFPAGGSIPNNIQFLCGQKYDQTGCVKDAAALRQAMAPYPLQLLGAWSFVLVRADDWKALVRGQGGDPVSPASLSSTSARPCWTQAGFYYNSFYYNSTINPVAHRNQNGKLAFSIPPGTTAVFHTHPQGHDLMS